MSFMASLAIDYQHILTPHRIQGTTSFLKLKSYNIATPKRSGANHGGDFIRSQYRPSLARSALA